MSRSQHILIVDDDASTVNILSLILQSAGYEVSADMTGELTFMQTGEHPHLVLMDNRLGYKHGADLCKQIKTNKATCYIPVIMISAMQNLETIASDACADNFLAKPFSIHQLLGLIQEMLGHNLVDMQ